VSDLRGHAGRAVLRDVAHLLPTGAMGEARLALRLAPRRTTALLHIATHPGASNREIATRIGIGDEGQTSKLLARMQGLGLVANRPDARHRNGRNAWYLTVAGRRLARALKQA
jgi:DNA-binding MarR family transcriptional regulator